MQTVQKIINCDNQHELDRKLQWELVLFHKRSGFHGLVLKGDLYINQVLWRMKRIRPKVSLVHMDRQVRP